MDLWATDTKGHFWQLTNVKFGYGGVIYPTFSWDGKKLAWGQRVSPFPQIFGSWELAVADWEVGAEGAPLLGHIQYYTPGAVHHYYEPHGFSLDNQTLFFMGNLEPGEARLGMDIYSLELGSGKLTNLTNTRDQWNEFPEPMPHEKKLIYMSTVGTASTASNFRCDLWSMNYDGSDKTRLTFYNDPSSPAYLRSGVCLCDPRWNADGSKLAVFNNQLAAHRHEVRFDGKSPGEMWLFDVKGR